MPVKTLCKYTSCLVVMLFLACLGGCSAAGGGDDTGPDDNSRPAGTPASIVLEATPDTVDAGELSTLQAVVRDKDGKPVGGADVDFEVLTNISGASLSDSSARTDGDGNAFVRYLAGATGGIDEIRAVVAKDNRLFDTISIEVIGTPGPASIELLVSSTQLLSGGTATVTLTALVKDSANNIMADLPVAFRTTSGSIEVTRGVTDQTGTAEALLRTSGDKSNRTITVTASVQNLLDTNTVNVTGTTISLSGPIALVSGSRGQFSLLLQDSAGQGIQDETVSLRSTAGNTLPATVVTGPTGNQTFELRADNDGPDTIEASALGAVGSLALTVSGDHFTLTVAQAAQDINLNTLRRVTVHWDKSGVNQMNRPITFFITRGELCDPGPPVNCAGASMTKNTNANGDVVVAIRSANAGPAVVTAQTSTLGGPSAQATVEFVAIDPTLLILQATPTTMGVNEQSIITATIRDAAGNLVKGKTISFSILDDETNGSISPSAALTSSSGQASTVYTAGATTSAQDGVIIEACVSNDPVPPAPCDTVALTVARQQLFVTLGTSHLIGTSINTLYDKPYSALVTDANGNPVVDATVELNVLATRYQKGFYRPFGVPCVGWVKDVTSTCNQEDINRNGRLDPGEDVNNNGTLEPGNVATNVSADLTTDTAGFVFFDVRYAREFTWVEVELEARVAVAGSEGSSTARFFLPGAADDFNDCTVSPPGQDSPFGRATTCACDELADPQCPTR